MADPQNLNNSSPGSLSTGSPPALQSALAPVAAGPSTPQTNAPPAPAPNVNVPGGVGLGGSGQPAQIGLGYSLAPIGVLNPNGTFQLPPLPPDAHMIFVANTDAFNTLKAAGAGAVPQLTFCLIQSVGVIQATKDGGANWAPYS